MDSSLILKEIYSMKENGEMIIFKVKGNFIIILIMINGSNIKVNLNLAIKMGLDNYFLKMVPDTKVNFVMIYNGDKEGCSVKVVK